MGNLLDYIPEISHLKNGKFDSTLALGIEVEAKRQFLICNYKIKRTKNRGNIL